MRFQESETVELKAEVTDEIKKEIVAFANGDGGKLYIGVADDGTVLGLNDADGVALQVSNMVRDAIKPDVTMFLRYETLNIEGRGVVAVDIQQGTGRPYYIARKGLRPEGVFVRQGYSSVPATDTAIRRMIKETDGDSFENMRSLEQELTFQAAQAEFSQRDIPFGPSQMKTLGLTAHDGVYTNLGCCFPTSACIPSRRRCFQERDRAAFRTGWSLAAPCLRRCTRPTPLSTCTTSSIPPSRG